MPPERPFKGDAARRAHPRGGSCAAVQCQLRKQPSFENSQRALRSPTMPLLMPAAAQERLTAAPSGLASHRLAEKVGKFVTSMLDGATRRSEARW